MKTYNITHLSIIALLLQIGILHADPFNKKTDSGLQCTVSAAEAHSLHLTDPANCSKNCLDCCLWSIIPGRPATRLTEAIVLTDKMLENRVGFKYDDNSKIYITSFGTVKDEAPGITYNSAIPVQLSVMYSVLDNRLIKGIPDLSDSHAILLQRVETKKEMYLGFRYRADGRWDITGIFDPEEAGGDLSGVFVRTDNGVDCKAIKKTTTDTHKEGAHTDDKTSSQKDKSTDGKTNH